MGLTIHWKFKAPADSTPADIRKVCEKLRQAAMDLPVNHVSELIERTGGACDFELLRCERGEKETPEEHALRWFLIQSTESVRYFPKWEPNCHYSWAVKPTHVIGFYIWVGPGCEPMDISFALFPEHANVYLDGRRMSLSTRKAGWTGRGFTKTQYASDPNCGGAHNFVRCHGSVIAMLDKAKELGVLKKVDDESGFWKKRDLKALVTEVGDWNEMIAANTGALKDMVGDNAGEQLVSPITNFPDFEHLEAKGAAKRPNLPKVLRQMKNVVDTLILAKKGG